MPTEQDNLNPKALSYKDRNKSVHRCCTTPTLLRPALHRQSIVVTEGVQVTEFCRKEARMADVRLYYLSKADTNFPSLTSSEQYETEIALTLECLKAQYLQLEQSAEKEARLVCDLSHNNPEL